MTTSPPSTAPGAHSPAPPPPSPLPLRSWVRASTLGWLLGIPSIAALALLGEAIGVGGSQALVGLGMGGAMGWVQGRQAANHGVPRAAWFFASFLGIGAPFLGWDVTQRLNLPLEYSLLHLLLIGGVVTGLVQGWLLGADRAAGRASPAGNPAPGEATESVSPPANRAGSPSRAATMAWWTAGCLVGWGAAGWSAGLGDRLIKTHAVPGLPGAILYLTTVAIGGPVLGLLTGAVLQRIRR